MSLSWFCHISRCHDANKSDKSSRIHIQANACDKCHLLFLLGLCNRVHVPTQISSNRSWVRKRFSQFLECVWFYSITWNPMTFCLSLTGAKLVVDEYCWTSIDVPSSVFYAAPHYKWMDVLYILKAAFDFCLRKGQYWDNVKMRWSHLYKHHDHEMMFITHVIP